MISREIIIAALANANVKAWLHVVRQRESSQTDRAYYMVNGRPDLTSLAQHPYYGIPTTQGSRASGAYQHLGTTWQRIAERYPKDCGDFSPYAQDFACVVGTNDRGALQDVINGHIQTAMVKCHPEWTSLPGGSENTGYTVDQALAVYAKYGGVWGPAGVAPIDVQEAAPIEERGTELPTEESDMGAGLVMALVQSLISGFAPLVQQKLGDAITKHGGDPTATASITSAIMNAVGTAVGTPVTTDAQAVAAVAAVQADPAKMAAVQNDSLAALDKMAPILDRLHQYSKDEWAAEESSKNAGADRAKIDATPDQDETLTISLVAFVGAILTALAVSMGLLIYFDKPYGEFLSLFSGAVGVILGKYGTRIDYRYGSSRASAAKDVTIAQMAKR